MKIAQKILVYVLLFALAVIALKLGSELVAGAFLEAFAGGVFVDIVSAVKALKDKDR